MPVTASKVTMNRPWWGEERTTRYCVPATSARIDPAATRSSRLVDSATITSPRSPWGLTTRPTRRRGPSPLRSVRSGDAPDEGGRSPVPPPSVRAGVGATVRDSVVDDVDAGLDPVAGPGGGDHPADGLGPPAPAPAGTAPVLRGGGGAG